jgi:hypothetical protein
MDPTRIGASPLGVRPDRLRTSLFGVGALAAVFVALTTEQPAASGQVSTKAFGFTGKPTAFVVPDGICRIRMELVGAAGGAAGTAGSPGAGALVRAQLRVEPGEVLRVRIGGWGGAADGNDPGMGGWNGGGAGGRAFDRVGGPPGMAGSGGGGATDVRRGGDGLEHRVLVAGGGGGGAGGGIGGQLGTGGGSGGDPIGAVGLAALGSANPASGGLGGTLRGAGDAGHNAPDGHVTARQGSFGAGGRGARGGTRGGGGGGGGLYGGGGGGAEFAWVSGNFGGGHGGGGSSLGPRGATFRSGIGASHGWATIGFDPRVDACRRAGA